jgi:oxaloacetate decarboxylase alpha subunit/pyruvate carboxylase subunit B
LKTVSEEKTVAKELKIRDLTLRDGQQSQFATRMTQAQVDRVLPLYKKAGFYAMEVWGGAVPDSVMRYLDEDPWTRLESIKAEVGDVSKLTALSRGRNLFGYSPYPDSVIQGFCEHAVRSGVDIMRIFDALNDPANMASSIRFVKEAGGMADCAICYTTDPPFTRGQRLSAFARGKPLPRAIFTDRYFVEKGKIFAALGADMISIKDMAGLAQPARAYSLVRLLKAETGLPVDLHTHCTPGLGVASMLMAMVAGADIVDTVILSWSGGPAAPAYEIIQLFADRMGLQTGVDKAAVAAIDTQLRSIRSELSEHDHFKEHRPPVLDLSRHELPPEDARLFDLALEAATSGKSDAVPSAAKMERVLELCRRIEGRFHYPAPNEIVRRAQIPGGMYTNMLSQLKEARLESHLGEVLAAVPRVRLDAGLPPLVTPTSQIVGVQAVNCVVDKAQGKEAYTNVSKNFEELVRGSYGKTPLPIKEAFRRKICGHAEERPYDVGSYAKRLNPALIEFGGARLAVDEKEELLLELFPSVAEKFLKGKRRREWDAAHPPEPEKPSRYADEHWESLARTGW